VRIRDLYTEDEIRMIQQTMKSIGRRKINIIFSYFLRWLIKQKKLIFTAYEFCYWSRRFTDVSLAQVNRWINLLKERGYVQYVRGGVWKTTIKALYDFGFIDLHDFLGIKYEGEEMIEHAVKKEYS